MPSAAGGGKMGALAVAPLAAHPTVAAILLELHLPYKQNSDHDECGAKAEGQWGVRADAIATLPLQQACSCCRWWCSLCFRFLKQKEQQHVIEIVPFRDAKNRTFSRRLPVDLSRIPAPRPGNANRRMGASISSFHSASPSSSLLSPSPGSSSIR